MEQKNIRLDKDGVRIVNLFMQNREKEMTAQDVSVKLSIDNVDAEIILKGLEKIGFLVGEGKELKYFYKVSEQVAATQITHSGGNDDTTRYIG